MFEYFSEGHPKFNSHLVKIVNSIVESKELTLEELKEYDLIKKLTRLLSSTFESGEDWCLDNLLDIIYELLHHIAEVLKTDDKGVLEESFEELLENFYICI